MPLGRKIVCINTGSLISSRTIDLSFGLSSTTSLFPTSTSGTPRSGSIDIKARSADLLDGSTTAQISKATAVSIFEVS